MPVVFTDMWFLVAVCHWCSWNARKPTRAFSRWYWQHLNTLQQWRQCLTNNFGIILILTEFIQCLPGVHATQLRQLDDLTVVEQGTFDVIIWPHRSSQHCSSFVKMLMEKREAMLSTNAWMNCRRVCMNFWLISAAATHGNASNCRQQQSAC